MFYYPDVSQINEEKNLVKSKTVLEEDRLIPSLDGKFTHFRYFKHKVSIEPETHKERAVITQDELKEILNTEKVGIVPYTVPFERSFAIVELQDLTSERRITNLLYDAVYEGIPISDLKIGLEVVALRVLELVKADFNKILLTDFNISQYRIPMPITFTLLFTENFLKQQGIDSSNIEFIVQSQELKNPFEMATLLSLGASKVNPTNYEEDLVDIANDYIQNLISKKGYETVKDYIGKKSVEIVGLKNSFLEAINPSITSTFEVEGLPEIESYIYMSK
ncbi:MAG: glutamate synthase central domain-containing protein [Sulfurihydrogenibium sp.]|uniref:glutamate synthase central domain-containing protein n=1 Tax=Sulfurihydrogenibium sp. TaxID=2053621 RepID=UPI003D152577